MVQISRPRLTRPTPRQLPAWGAGAAGLIVALVAIVLPGSVLEGVVEGSGIAAVLPVAAPPLGVTARAVLALGGGAGVAAVMWAALYLLFGPGGPLAAKPRATARAAAPTVRRGDTHPDAPPRWPLSMTELVLPTDRVVWPPVPWADPSETDDRSPAAPPPPAPVVWADLAVPGDLDIPLAAFDPDALRPVPMEPVRALKPLAQVLAPGERLETYTLTPPSPPPAPPRQASEPPSIDALLRRLEQGARRRTATAH